MGLCGDDSLDGQTAQTMQNLISQHALNNSDPAASYDHCTFPRPNRRTVTAEESVVLAECFIIQNGYTDLPPMEDRSQLTPESVWRAQKSGVCRGGTTLWSGEHFPLCKMRDTRVAGWLHFVTGEIPIEFDIMGTGLIQFGRAVTMDAYGKRMRVEHQDLSLNFPELQRSNR